MEKEKCIVCLENSNLTRLPGTIASQDHKQWKGRGQPFLTSLWHMGDDY